MQRRAGHARYRSPGPPDGAALYNLSNGGGTFTVDGQESFYTQKQDVVYENTHQPVEFTYAKGADYKKGIHTVELPLIRPAPTRL